MRTYKTIEAARAAQAERPDVGIQQTIRIVHATDGECYINAKCTIQRLADALRSKPMPEIVSVIDTVVDYRESAVGRAPKPVTISRGPGYCYNCQSYCYGDCGQHYRPRPKGHRGQRR